MKHGKKPPTAADRQMSGKSKRTVSKKKSTADTDGRSRNKGNPANLKPWQPGQSGNPKGGPKRGESWSDLIKKIGDLSGTELADYFETYRAELRKVGRVTLKEAAVIRVYLALLFEPNSALFNSLMDRAEGTVAQKQEHSGSGGGPIIFEVIYGDDGTRAKISGLSSEATPETG